MKEFIETWWVMGVFGFCIFGIIAAIAVCRDSQDKKCEKICGDKKSATEHMYGGNAKCYCVDENGDLKLKAIL